MAAPSSNGLRTLVGDSRHGFLKIKNRGSDYLKGNEFPDRKTGPDNPSKSLTKELQMLVAMG
jgi:hypothetical protein